MAESRFGPIVSQSAGRPNMPLRKPAPNPNLKPSRSETRSETALFAKKNFSFCQVSEEFLAKTGSPSRDVSGDAKNVNRMETNRSESGSSSTEDMCAGLSCEFKLNANKEQLSSASESLSSAHSMMQLQSSSSLKTVRFCHFCGLKGPLRCTQCKKTNYCSVSCQKEDWPAHRHVCKQRCQSETPRGLPVALAGSRLKVATHKRATVEATSEGKRMSLSDLQKMEFENGTELQASVIEFKTPGKFFIHIRTVEIMESLRKVTLALQKTYTKTDSSDEYLPAKGEVCAAKYSQDQNWYRGLVQTVDSSLKKVNILYIDFGNEEDVTLNRLQPLSKDIDPLWPSAVQCRVAQLVPVKGTWSEECCNSARQMLLGQACQISIVETLHGEASFAVHITVPKIGKQIDSYLIEQGYAAKEEDAKNSQAECDINTILNTALENYKSNVSERNEENNQTQVPEPITLCIDEAFVSVVTHVTSPDDFILQQLQNASVIQKLQTGLREHCLQTAASVDFRPARGTICCSQFTEDNQWYRATVLSYTSKDKVYVGYIDFGNCEELNVDRIRPVTEKFLQLPMQAIPCALAGVKPILGIWTPEAILIMKKLVSSKFLKAKVVGRKERKALVELCDEHSDPQASITELLIATGYAAAAAAAAAADEEEEERKKHKADSAVKTEDAAPTVPLPEKLEWTSAGLPDSQAVDVAVSVLHSPGEFYCQRYITRDLQALNELSVELSRYCRAESNLFTPAVGEPCCAVFPGDGNWYRAMVKEVASNGKAKVYFVDYGNTCELAADQLRPIVAKYLKHPFQAIKCWLAGIKPLEKDWTKDAIARFQALTRGTQPKVQVVSKNKSGFGIDMRWKEQSIASILVAEELAVAENANIAETPAAAPPASPHKGGSFPHRWKTAELPLNETFQLHIAEVVNPSLIFAMNIDSQVDMQNLQPLMVELAEYCSSQSQHADLKPKAGVACCARFSGDKNWYRAIVLETFDTAAKVIYADYGNSESVEYSSILPIQEKHLALPFQVVKCALAAQRESPGEWPQSSVEQFKTLVQGRKVFASVQEFDGELHTVNLKSCAEDGSVNVAQMIMEDLSKSNSKSTTAESVAQTIVEDLTNCSAAPTTTEPQPTCRTKCCCAHLSQKVDKLEKLLLMVASKLMDPQKNC
ncbi:tudor domain-containing protein 1-like isoform X2 [Acipenser ruthenus]|uniref:tudor domain-containing protein 1-like isoform X2 n=1 Tax=Acipenser ruthenus TaxID=7906 RepID=UPI002740E075|nr:tudor domain-containing protein 1-like isoform X2 [Acipenser ruthenus]